ncbi:MAG TPA: septum formation initiator family protein [Patescibacteria group bacterium]|nr:septum formation initiator family protein [Patescibacteria group bacterium]
MIVERRQITRGILAFVSLGIILSAGRTIIDLWQRRDVLEARKHELAKLREENEALEHTLQDMQSESYVERIARDKLGMVKEGETIVILPDAVGERSFDKTQDGQMNNNLPNWKKWWKLFF